MQGWADESWWLAGHACSVVLEGLTLSYKNKQKAVQDLPKEQKKNHIKTSTKWHILLTKTAGGTLKCHFQDFFHGLSVYTSNVCSVGLKKKMVHNTHPTSCTGPYHQRHPVRTLPSAVDLQQTLKNTFSFFFLVPVPSFHLQQPQFKSTMLKTLGLNQLTCWLTMSIRLFRTVL